MSFSENLMRLRKSKGLSQEEFANEIDVTRQTVSKWELGVSTPDMDKLVQMSNFFGISVDDLLTSEDATSKVNAKVEEVTQNQTVDNNVNKNPDPEPEPKKSSNTLAKVFVVLLIGAIITIIIVLMVILVKDLGEDKDSKSSTKKSSNEISNVVENKIENNVSKNTIENKIENTIAPSDFNSPYHNGRTKGEDVEKDLSSIITNNKTNKKIKINVKSDDKDTNNPEEIAEIKKGLAIDGYYEITLDYDDDGYIKSYKIEVSEVTQIEKSSEANSFNVFYHRGTRSGFFIQSDLERIITSNMEHPNKQIYVNYEDINSNEKEVIKSIKNNIGKNTNYNIEFEYDAEGYINKYIIEKE